MQAVLGLLLFSVLLARASSLDCELCNANAKTCAGKKMPCEDKNDVCLQIQTEATGGVFKIEKKCEKQSECESLRNLKGKPATSPYTGVIKDVVCSKAPLSSASLLLTLCGFLLKNILL